jgi:glutamine synthetase
MVLARILISRTARLHRLRASFSPFPEKDGAGNGAHQHVSFTRTGRPVLSGGDGPNGLTAEGAAAIAGLVASLPDFMAVLASSPLSHLRLQPGLWSGAYCCWGLENREAAVRFCAATQGNPNGANIEIKVVDPSANPYLSSAVILGMAGAGMRAGLPLPAEVSVDPAGLSEQDRRAAGVRLLPSAVPEMLKRLQAAPLAQHILGITVDSMAFPPKPLPPSCVTGGRSDQELRRCWTMSRRFRGLSTGESAMVPKSHRLVDRAG